jgi:hypothetical protein
MYSNAAAWSGPRNVERKREREREGEGRGEGEEEGNEKKDMGINFEGSFGQRGNSLTWSAALAWSIDFY